MLLAEKIKNGVSIRKKEIETLFRKYEVDAPVSEDSVLYFCSEFAGTPAVREMNGILSGFTGDNAPQGKFADVLNAVTEGVNQVNNIVNPQVQQQKEQKTFFVVATVLIVIIFLAK